MSLINDALKRARNAQDEQPQATSGPELQHVEPAHLSARGLGGPTWLVLALALIAALGLLALGPVLRGKAHEPLSVSAKTPAAPQNHAEPSEPAPVADVATDPATTQDVAENTSAENASGATLPEQSPKKAMPLKRPAEETQTTTTEAPPPPMPRLQAIIYHPKRPSAMIDGKTLFLGEAFGGRRLVAVTRTSATLVGLGVTNIVTLAPH